MSAMLVTLVALVSTAAYFAAAGAVGLTFFRRRKSACRACNQPDDAAFYSRCINDHGAAAVMAGVGWPFLLPVLLGMWFVDRDQRTARHAARLADEIDRLERETGIGGKRR